MTEISEQKKMESIHSYQSTIRKMEKALAGMEKKGSDLKLIRRRLESVRIGLAALEYAWSDQALSYHPEEMKEAREVLSKLLPSMDSAYLKAKEGSPQRTLLERRILSFKQSMEIIDDLIRKY